MPKLFLFGIGGTGVRVIKSLVMLLASGVSINADEIIPIIIDPDANNADLTRTIDCLNKYVGIHNAAANHESNFFKQKITSLNHEQGREFRLKIDLNPGNNIGILVNAFRNFIGYDSLDEINKSHARLLFSGYVMQNGRRISLLDLDMSVGFKGNPQLGSIVLNQFNIENEDFRAFANAFTQGDRILIINSIHGGTGAAGFPLLLKNLRNAVNLPQDQQVANSNLISNSIIGNVLVLPYFSLKPGDIDSGSFIARAKAALEYYAGNVNSQINYQFYIANSRGTTLYNNNAGGLSQENKANFIELIAAISVLDFMNINDNLLPKGDTFKEFGVREYKKYIDFSKLDRETKEKIRIPLSQYFLFYNYLKMQFLDSINKQPWSNRGKVIIGSVFKESEFYDILLTEFNKHFFTWLNELYNNNPPFRPFRLDITEKDLLNFYTDKNEYSLRWREKFLKLDNFVLFDNLLNHAERTIKVDIPEKKFLAVFYQSTKELLNKLSNE